MPPFVLDASVAACWAFEDEDHPIASAALAHMPDEGAIVTGLWWFEIRNTMVVNERRGRIAQPDTTMFLRSLRRMAIVADLAPEEASILALARTHGLSVYDASYLELAMRRDVPLATLDTALIRAARAAEARLMKPA